MKRQRSVQLRNSLAIVLAALAGIGCATGEKPNVEPIEVPRTVDDDPTLPTVSIGDYTFHGEAFGATDSPVVIVVHGGPGADYRSLQALKELSDRYRVLFYDQRGAGLSPRVPAEEISFEVYISDLAALADTISPNRSVTLIAHSFGGQLATAFAGRYPGRVERLVLLEPGPLNDDMARIGPTTRFSLRLLPIGAEAGRMARSVRGPDVDAADDFRMGYIAFRANPGYHCDPDRVTTGERGDAWRFGTTAWRSVSASMRNGRRHVDLTDGLERLTAPVLLLAGSCNTVIGPDYQAMQLRFFPKGSLKVIDGAGHQILLDQPAATLAAVRAFLEESTR
jgi:proline iminopeptidase